MIRMSQEITKRNKIEGMLQVKNRDDSQLVITANQKKKHTLDI